MFLKEVFNLCKVLKNSAQYFKEQVACAFSESMFLLSAAIFLFRTPEQKGFPLQSGLR